MNKFKKFSAWCGIIAPVLLFLTIIILGFLNPDYSHIIEGISGLGAVGEPNAIVMNFIGFFIIGILIMFFSFGIHKGINQGKESKTGMVFLFLCGVFWVLIGLFPIGAVNSFSERVHGLAAFFSFLSGGIGIMIISRKFKKDAYWKKYSLYSLLSGLIIITGVLFLGRLGIYGGLNQRIFLAVLFLWIELTAINLLKKANPNRGLCKLAEGVGFEPTSPKKGTALQAVPLSRFGTLPFFKEIIFSVLAIYNILFRNRLPFFQP